VLLADQIVFTASALDAFLGAPLEVGEADTVTSADPDTDADTVADTDAGDDTDAAVADTENDEEV
jgi:hypothetical protein